MPAASYREVPDGHSSRKQKSKRRRAKRSPSFVSGRVIGHCDIPPRCVPGRSTMAKCSRNAFPSVRQWQDCALMRSWPDWQRQYSRAMRSRASIRGKIPPRCVLGRQSVASFALHASQKWSRTGKLPVRGKIRAPCIRNELVLAGYARHASEKPRKSPFGNARREDLARKDPFSLHGPLESRMARRSCHPLTLDLSATRRLR